MTDILLSTFPKNWTSDGGGHRTEGTFIAKNTETGCRLSVSVGTLSGISYSLTAGEALSFADGAKVLQARIDSREEVAALAVRFMKKYPKARWQGGRRGCLVDGDSKPIRFPTRRSRI